MMISALERLRVLRSKKTFGIPPLLDLDDLPMDWRIEFEERAAIMEYNGGLSREEAEMRALQEINEKLK